MTAYSLPGYFTTLTAGETTNIIGGQVLGDSVTLNTTNLNIESLQDTATYDSSQKGGSIQGTLFLGGGGSVSGSYNQSNITADYASVNEQSGILAGNGGYNINVTNDTSLIGGIITSTQSAEDNGLNSFSTGTLTVQDIQNFSRYDGDSFGISAGFEVGKQGSAQPDAKTGKPTGVFGSDRTLGVSKSIGYGSDSDSQTSTTYSGINTSNITITGTDDSHPELVSGSKEITAANLADIFTSTTTDTIQANSGSLTNTFDAEAVQNELDVQVRVTQEFNTIAPAIIADYAISQAERLRSEGNEEEASKWDEGGAYRIALQSVVGGLSGGISGAAGAGLTATAIPTIGEAINNSESIPGELKPLLIEAAGATIGAIAGEIVGGDATAGAISGFSNVENNYLTHWEKEQQAIAKNKCNQGDKEACKEFSEWNRLDKERSFGSYFVGAVGQGFSGAWNGYQDVRDNSPWYAKYTLKFGITWVEMGLTSGLSGTAKWGYDFFSGMNFDTQPLTPAGFVGQTTGQEINDINGASNGL